jgi:hypothetical protein
MSTTFKGAQGAIIRIPDISTKIKGNTGIDKSLIKTHGNDHSIEDAVNEMKQLPRTEYIKEYWDCDDRALYAISRARCKFPDMPVGLAIGKAADQSIVEGLHAVVVVWSKDFSRGEYYEPELRDTLDFNSQVIVPFPCQGTRQGDGIPFASDLPFLQRGGAFVLDNTYDFGKVAAAKEFLKEAGPEECEDSRCPDFKSFYHQYDRALSMWINFKKEKELLGAPLGIAFGEWRNKHQAVLLLWEDPAKRPSCWTISNMELPSDKAKDFKPSIIIV